MLVGDGERVAVEAVLRSEVPFEVRRPEIIRVRRRGGDGAGMLARAAPPPLLHQAVARHRSPAVLIAGQRDAGDVAASATAGAFQAPSSDAAVVPCRSIGDIARDAMRATVRGPAAVAECRAAACVEPIEPFVARLAADGVARRRARSSCTGRSADRE